MPHSIALAVSLVLVVLFAPFTAPVSAEPVDTAAELNKRVVKLYRAGKYAEATKIAERVLTIREKVLGSQHPRVGTSLNNLAELYRIQGRHAEAKPLHRRALAIREKVFGREHPTVAQSLSNLADLYRVQGRYVEAEPLHKRALTIREKVLGAEHLDVANSLNSLAILYRARGRYAEAEPLYRRAIVIQEKALGSEHPIVATSLSNLAVLYVTQGRYGEAAPLHRRAIAIREKVLGPWHPDLANSLNNLAVLLGYQNRYAEAESLYQRALAIREKTLGPGHAHVAQSLANLATIYSDLGRYAKAEPLYRRAIEIGQNALGQDHPDVVTDTHNLAVLYRAQGRYGEAEPLFRRTLAIREKALGPAHTDVADSLNSLALLSHDQGRYAEAELLHRRALAIREKALGPGHADVAQSLANLAGIYRAAGRYGEAEPLFRRAIEIEQTALGPDHPSIATSLHNLAVLYEVQRRYADAEPLYRRALVISEKAFGPGHPSVAGSLNNLAAVYRAQKRYGEAESLHRRALSIQRKVLAPDHLSLAASLNSLALLSFVQKDWQKATNDWRQSTAIIMRRTARGAPILGKALTGRRPSEADRQTPHFLGLVKAGFRLSSERPSEQVRLGEELFRAIQWTQGTEAAASLAKAAVRGAKGDPKLAALVRERQDLIGEWQKRDQLRIKQFSAPPDKRNAEVEKENASRLKAIETRIADIDRQLAADFPDYAALANPEPLSVADVQAQLRSDEVLVLFMDTPEQMPTPEETFIWVVTKTDMRWLRSGLGSKALREKVAALRAGLDPTAGGTRGAVALTGAGGSFDLALAHELYRELLAPAEDLIKDKPHLIMVPSGPLTGLPFQVLVTKEPEAGAEADYAKASWLIRRHAITTLPSVASLKVLRREQNRTPAPKPYLAFADPIFNPAAANVNVKAPRVAGRGVASFFRGGVANGKALADLPRLASTATEVRAIAKAFGPQAALHIGPDASEGAIKELPLDQYRILHLATHGLVAGEVTGLAEAALALSAPKTPGKDDDGLLTASEVAALKLNADWVVLSACNTAAGDRPGAEALSGLARAFFYAGAKSLLVSHWPVLDDAAVALTTGAFGALKTDTKIGKAEALRQSMLALIDGGDARASHPSYWAPFVVVGEGGASG